jgi:hypothetical protein
MRAGRFGFVFAVVATMTTATIASSRADETFGLAVHVADVSGTSVRDDTWIRAQIADAEKLYSPLGVHVRWALQGTLDSRFARLETRRDRDALAAVLEPGVINVMVVESLRDVDDPSLFRMGVCWRPRPDVTYVIVAASARPTVLAHELGHYFGNGHSTVVNNVMSYTRTDGDVFLSPAQAATVQWTARDLVRRGLLSPLPAPRFWP